MLLSEFINTCDYGDYIEAVFNDHSVISGLLIDIYYEENEDEADITFALDDGRFIGADIASIVNVRKTKQQ